MKKALLLSFFVFALCAMTTSAVYAETPTHTLPGGQATGAADCTAMAGSDPLSALFCGRSLPEMVNGLFQIAIQVGAILAMLRIGYAGYLYMGSADMWSSLQHAKDVFRDAIIGLLLLLAIYLILYQINPCILDLGVLGNGSASSECRAGNSIGTSGFASPAQRQ
jgi:hypothetical protein